MNGKKKLMFVMPVMKGGGAEKVAALLLNEFQKNGCECELILTNSERGEVVNRGLDSDIKLTVLREHFEKKGFLHKAFLYVFRIFASVICKIPEAFKKRVPAPLARLSFNAQYYDEIKALRKIISSEPSASILSFLQPSIPLTLLASEGLPNKVVVSERSDPYRLLKKRYGYNFIKKYYQRAETVVFQTNDAMAAYPDNISAKGKVIFNPLHPDLPEPYFGQRNKTISTFCRITRSKNFPVLIKAFSEFSNDFDDYRLKIIGAPQNDDDKLVLKQTTELIKDLGLEEKVVFLPFSAEVHSLIINDAMYVNSSDYEGMSNAMLEAMAIGMPVICTDCPIGGANAVIQSGKNGILTEVGNSSQISAAMKKIAGDRNFADMLSHNAAEIRYKLSLENTAKKWMELL